MEIWPDEVLAAIDAWVQDQVSGPNAAPGEHMGGCGAVVSAPSGGPEPASVHRDGVPEPGAVRGGTAGGCRSLPRTGVAAEDEDVAIVKVTRVDDPVAIFDLTADGHVEGMGLSEGGRQIKNIRPATAVPESAGKENISSNCGPEDGQKGVERQDVVVMSMAFRENESQLERERDERRCDLLDELARQRAELGERERRLEEAEAAASRGDKAKTKRSRKEQAIKEVVLVVDDEAPSPAASHLPRYWSPMPPGQTRSLIEIPHGCEYDEVISVLEKDGRDTSLRSVAGLRSFFGSCELLKVRRKHGQMNTLDRQARHAITRVQPVSTACFLVPYLFATACREGLTILSLFLGRENKFPVY